MEAERRKLPIGIQTFREIREEGYYYADKTSHIRRLAREGKHYFLSRPRRFGKSLLLDTIKELFEGSEALFRGLAILESWNWSQRHPVVRLSFGRGDFTSPDYVHETTIRQIAAAERRAGLNGDSGASAPERFAELIEGLRERFGERVVVLVDEYDKPILDALGQPEVARANRDFLRGLYSVIKDSDAHMRFTLLAGISKFSKVNLFSGLNNLIDITLDPEHATICGYREADLDTVFAPEMAGLDREEVRAWYNGYSWDGKKRVYDDLAAVGAELRALFAGIPADCHRRNDIARFEGYYASVFYAAVAALGMDLSVEDASSAGRLDLAMRCDGRVYLFGFKVAERASEGAALRQLAERGYAGKYRHLGEPIRLVGIEFSEATRNISAFDAATA